MIIFIIFYIGDNNVVGIKRSFSPNKTLYKQSLRNKNYTKAYSLGANELTNLLHTNTLQSSSAMSNFKYNNSNITDMLQVSPKNDPNILLTAHMINNSNIIFQQVSNMISEQDIKFQLLENNSQLESYLKSLDNTPVYYTFNCGVIYVPYKSKIFISIS